MFKKSLKMKVHDERDFTIFVTPGFPGSCQVHQVMCRWVLLSNVGNNLEIIDGEKCLAACLPKVSLLGESSSCL